MELYDANHDGFLDAKELEQVPGLKAAIKQIDANHDGKITEQEIADRIKFWTDSRMGRMSVKCRVLHNGKPLVGAKVVFVPEKFLGGTLQPGSGTSATMGFAQITRLTPAIRPSRDSRLVSTEWKLPRMARTYQPSTTRPPRSARRSPVAGKLKKTL